MKNDRINYLVVGTFVLLMLGGIVVSVALLTGRTGPTDTYFTRFTDATGIKFGTNVLYMGYPVGQVEEITPVPTRDGIAFELELAITRDFKDWKVPVDSVAEVRAAGLLAAITIDIRRGTSDSVLQPGGHLRGVERPDLFTALTQTANTFRELTETSVRPLLENLNRYVDSVGAALEADAPPMLRALRSFSEHLADRGPAITESIVGVAQAVRATSERLNIILSDENADKVGGIVDNVLVASQHLAALTNDARIRVNEILTPQLAGRVDEISLNITAASGDVRELAGFTNQRVQSILSEGNVKHIDTTLSNLDAASETLKGLSETANQQLARVLAEENVVQVDKIIDDLSLSAATIKETTRDVRTQLKTLLGPDTAEKVDAVLANVSRASSNIADLSEDIQRELKNVLSPQMMAKVRQALTSFSIAADNVAHLTGDLRVTRKELDRLIANVNGMVTDNRPDVRAAVSDLRHTLATVAEHVDAVAYNLEETSRNMSEFSRQIRGDPSILLRGTGVRKEVDGARSTGTALE